MSVKKTKIEVSWEENGVRRSEDKYKQFFQGFPRMWGQGRIFLFLLKMDAGRYIGLPTGKMQ